MKSWTRSTFIEVGWGDAVILLNSSVSVYQTAGGDDLGIDIIIRRGFEV